jgi:Chaperone for flagella basal body P-ring formation
MKARLTRLGGTIALLFVVVARGATSSEPTVLLLSDVAVRQPQFSLADVLPAAAPDDLRARAAQVSLGESPMPGEHRVLDQEFISRVLDKLPNLREELAIPPRIDVTRWSRPVSNEDFLAPITKALAGVDLANSGALFLSDISLLSPVIATEEHVEARVLRIEMDAGSKAARVRMWIPSEPRVPPFWARVRIGKAAASSHVIGLSASTIPIQPAAGTPPPPQQAGRSTIVFDRLGQTEQSKTLPILVRTGQPVELVVDAGGMRITSRAVSLEVGHAGDNVRVRVEPVGKILVGKVVASETVEVSY